MSQRTLIDEKICTKCNAGKPLSEFHKQPGGLFGLRGKCKHCAAVDAKEHREREKDRLKARRAELYLVNRDSERQRASEYRAKNRDAIKAAAARYNASHKEERARWVKENPERIRMANARWYAKNAEKARAARAERYRNSPEKAVAATMKWARANKDARNAIERNRRARIRNAKGNHSGADIGKILSRQRGRCAVCGKDIRSRRHVDHIVALANGGSNDCLNLQILCPPCNQSKGAKDPITFMQERGFLL